MCGRDTKPQKVDRQKWPPHTHTVWVSEAAELDSSRVSGALSASPTGKAGRALYGLNLLSPLLPASLYSFCYGYPQHSRNPTNDPTLPSVWGIRKRQVLENKKRFKVLPTWGKACVLTYTLNDLGKSPMTSDLSLLHCKWSLTPWLASQGLGDMWAAHTI